MHGNLDMILWSTSEDFWRKQSILVDKRVSLRTRLLIFEHLESLEMLKGLSIHEIEGFVTYFAERNKVQTFVQLCDHFELDFEYRWKIAAQKHAYDIIRQFLSDSGGSWEHFGNIEEYAPSKLRICILGSGRAGKSCVRYSLASTLSTIAGQEGWRYTRHISNLGTEKIIPFYLSILQDKICSTLQTSG